MPSSSHRTSHAAARTTAKPGPPDTEASRDYGLTTQVTMAALKATAGLRINLHAGGVADERHRVLAVVAPSGTGKTTATLALAKRLGYVSDETVSIDPDGTVAPHPKPLSVVLDPQRLRDKQQLSPDDLGLMPTPDEGRLARLVVLQRGAARGEGSDQARHRARGCCSSSSSRRRCRSFLARSMPW